MQNAKVYTHIKRKTKLLKLHDINQIQAYLLKHANNFETLGKS